MRNLDRKSLYLFGLLVLTISAGPVNAGFAPIPPDVMALDEVFNTISLEGHFNIELAPGSLPMEGFAVGLDDVSGVSTTRTDWLATLISEAQWTADTSIVSLLPTSGFSASLTTLDFGSYASLFGTSDAAAFYTTTASFDNPITAGFPSSEEFFYAALVPSSPYIAFNYPPGNPPAIAIGTTSLTLVPIPPAIVLLALPLAGLGRLRRRQ